MVAEHAAVADVRRHVNGTDVEVQQILDHQTGTVTAAAAQQQQLTQSSGQQKRSKRKGQHNCSYRSDGTVFQQVAQQQQSAPQLWQQKWNTYLSTSC